MSIDYLQVAKNRSTLRPPGSELNSAGTSVTQGVALGRGFDVTDAGLQTPRAYPDIGFGAISVVTGATVSIISSLMRVTAFGAAAVGVKLAPGTGNEVAHLVNVSDKNITFDSMGNGGRVADGQNVRLASYSGCTFVWENQSAFWVGFNNR